MGLTRDCTERNNPPFASIIAHDSIGGSRKAVVRLRFDERVIDKGVRSLQLIVRSTLWSYIGGAVRIIARNCPSANGAEQVTGLWITESRLWHDDADSAVGVILRSAAGRR